MFTELAKLLRTGDTLLATIAIIEPEKFRLTITPRLTALTADGGKVLNQPIAIEGTADELDVELPAALGGFRDTVNSAREALTQAAGKIAEAAKKAPAKPAPAPAKPAAKPAAKAAAPAAAPAAAKPAAPAPAKPAFVEVPKPTPKPDASLESLRNLAGKSEPPSNPQPATQPAAPSRDDQLAANL